MQIALPSVTLDSLPQQMFEGRKTPAKDSEFKAIPFDEVKVNRKRRTIEGWAARYGNIDLGNDRIHSGAAAKTIAERMPSNGIKFFWNHYDAIGMPESIKEEEGGIFMAAKVNKDPSFDKYMSLIEQKVASHLSIGYRAVRVGFTEDEETSKEVREIFELKLYEISAVMFPMNEAAAITAVKAAHAMRGFELVGDAIRNVQMATAFLAIDAVPDAKAAILTELLDELKYEVGQMTPTAEEGTPEPKKATTSRSAPSDDDMKLLSGFVTSLEEITNGINI